MKPFEYLEQTADVRVRVYGADQRELFEHAVLAVSDAMRPVWKDESRVRTFDVQSPGPEDLLIDFLNEAIASTKTNKEAYERVEFTTLTPFRAAGTLTGRGVERFDIEIKAATYHDLAIKHIDTGLVADVTFDIVKKG